MIPAGFDYTAAETVEQAVKLLQQHGDDAQVLAGGHSLIPMMKLRLARPGILIDIGRIPGMRAVAQTPRGLQIGALATHAEIAEGGDVASYAPALCDAAAAIGDVQVRHRGTIGGSAAHADAAADYPAALLVLGAQFELAGPSGRRSVSVDDFFVDMFTTALRGDEILTAVVLPKPASASSYVKLPHPASHYPVVGAACALDVRDGTVAAARVAVTGVGSKAFRVPHVESALAGIAVSDHGKLESVCASVARGVEARADVYAGAAYRTAMADVMTARAVLAAAERAG